MNTTKQHQRSMKQDTGPAPVSLFAWLNAFTARNLLVLLLMSAVVGSALAVVHVSFQHRTAFHELQQSREMTNNLDVQWGQLLIEQSTFGLEGRIERRAMEELGMRLPDWSTIKMVRHE